MTSPESDKPAAKSPPVKDSPTFGYVNSLSPIKPVNAGQLYESIDVPSPQLVFKTPNFSRPIKSILLERSQLTALAGAENLSPGYANTLRELSENLDITGASCSLTMAQLIPYSSKQCIMADPSPNHSSMSPSKCVDAFLADPSENCDISSSSPEFCVKRTTKDIEDECANSCGNLTKSLEEDLPQDHSHSSTILANEQTDISMETSSSMISPHLHSKQDSYLTHTLSIDIITKESEEDPGNTSVTAETMEINKESITEQLEPASKNVNSYTSINLHENSSLYQHAIDHDLAYHEKPNTTTSDFLCHGEQDLKWQTSKAGQSDELDCTPELCLDSPQSIQTGDKHIDNSANMSSTSTQEDGVQHQRGKRKRLHFEASENLKISNKFSFTYTTKASNLNLSTAPAPSEMQTVYASLAESITMPGNYHIIQPVPENAPCRFSVEVDRSAPRKESTHMTTTRRAGIGLHLNSIGSAASMNCNANMQLLERSATVQEEKEHVADNNQVFEKSMNCPASMSLSDPTNSSFSSEELLHYTSNEKNEVKQQGNQIYQQHSSVNYPTPLSVKPLNSSVPSKLIDRYMTPCIMKILPSDETNKSEESTATSPRKKRKKAFQNDGEQKRCNCKRSKCLKLYCDCFAAGSFCSEACACQDCSNRVEYKETVQETRQQIESRNPLAFAPKVVVRTTEPPKTSGDIKPITPTSARHKRGCNCKKSLCLKKYCECFQAGVGCSLGCRCEGCKNTFGTKDGCEIPGLVVEHKRPDEGVLEKDLYGELEGIEVNRHTANTKHCHSQLSPLTPVVQSSMGSAVPKPQFPSSYYPSPDSVASMVRSFDPSTADIDASGSSSFNPSGLKTEYQNEGKIGSFSPGWEGFPELCNLSLLLKTTPNAGDSSSTAKTGEGKTLRATLFQGKTRISLEPLCWRASPMTPMPQFGEARFLRCNPDDDTPEVLKDAHVPIKPVKATSPNQKRVSLPQPVVGGSNTQPPSCVRSGRKFVLRSLPTFPPLSPYSKSNREDGT